MIHLNEVNGADKVELEYAQKCLDEFAGDIIGVQMGIAYGGGVEKIAKLWKDRGIIYGYDVFEETHPKELTDDKFEADCMDYWYQLHGTEMLSYSYQKGELEDQGLTNAILIKGRVNKDSCSQIPYIHYAFLDMDILESMHEGYQAVKDKIVPNGYLLIHDYFSIPSLRKYFDEVAEKDDWKVVDKVEGALVLVLQRKE
jgi:hypothetical protein